MPPRRATTTASKRIDRDRVIGYVVVGSGRGAAFVRPIYHGDYTIKTRERGEPTLTIVSTYELGELLNGRGYHEDDEGCTLADIAASAIGALVRRSEAARRPRRDTVPRRKRAS